MQCHSRCVENVNSLKQITAALNSELFDRTFWMFEGIYFFQEPLQNFVTECDSTFGCVHCNGQLLVATPKWWSLSGQEMMLLCRLVHSLPTNSASDIPVYLPHASPKVSMCKLTGGIVNKNTDLLILEVFWRVFFLEVIT